MSGLLTAAGMEVWIELHFGTRLSLLVATPSNGHPQCGLNTNEPTAVQVDLPESLDGGAWRESEAESLRLRVSFERISP